MCSSHEGFLRPRGALTRSWEPLGFGDVAGYPAPAELSVLGKGQEATGAGGKERRVANASCAFVLLGGPVGARAPGLAGH